MAVKEGEFLKVARANIRSREGENKKRLILQVATEVFAEKGFKQATISQIAKKANIAEGSIYDYFRNKEDMLLSIPDERMEIFLSQLREHLKGVTGALHKLRKIIWFYLYFYEKNKDYTQIFVMEVRQNPRFYQSQAYCKARECSKIILEVIEEGKNEKVIRKEIDPFILRDIIFGSMEHIAIRACIMKRVPNLSEAVDGLFDQIIEGVAEKNRMIRVPLNRLIGQQLKINGRQEET